MHGINIIFCKKTVERINRIPFHKPHVAITDEIVYPKQKPLKATTRYTIDIPITVDPMNHSIKASTTFFFIESLSKTMSFISLFSFKDDINEVM